MCITLHLFELKHRFHLVDQSSRLVRSSCSALWSSKLKTRLYNLCTGDATTLGMSLIKKTNGSGPNTLPNRFTFIPMSFFEVYTCGTSQFAGSSGPVPYALHVFNGVKWIFRLSLSLPRKIVMIAFMHCKAVVRIKVG